MLTVYGAGAVGLVVGARLARAGTEVLFMTRRPESAEAIATGGVHFEDPASGETWTAAARAVAGVEAASALLGKSPVLFCMRSMNTDVAAAALARVAPNLCVASFQNDVDNESRLAAHFPRVIGAVVRQTCTRTSLDHCRATGAGRIVLGSHPSGVDSDAIALAEQLRAADYDVGLSQRIDEDLWLKLVVNLMSAPNALVRRSDHTSRDFVEIKARLIEEGKAATEAAAIVTRSCDGRDRSLAEEIHYQRESVTRGTSARTLPLYNQVWTALETEATLEADHYHRRIVELAAMHGLGAPQNRQILSALERAHRLSMGPECYGAAELLAP